MPIQEFQIGDDYSISLAHSYDMKQKENPPPDANGFAYWCKSDLATKSASLLKIETHNEYSTDNHTDVFF